MNIDIVSFTGFDSLNGSNLRLFFLTKELIKRGNNVRFITPGKDDALSCKKIFGVDAIDVGLEIKRFESTRLKRYPIFAMKSSKKINKNADLVLGQSLPSALAVRRAKTKAKKIIDYVDLWSEYWLYANPGLGGKLIYQAVRRGESHSLKVDKIFTITRELKRMLIERGAKPEKISIVRDGVDTKMFNIMKIHDSFFEKYGLEKNIEYITYQGGIAAHDGVQFMVKAAPSILNNNPDAKFLIVGDGVYLSKIKTMVNKSKLQNNFIFTGWVPYSDMPFFMNLAKINVVPLPNAPATRGVVTLKLFEAMACGSPTIIGNLPAVREVVEHEKTAYLVKSEDNVELSEGVNELMNNNALYNRMKMNGIELVKKHDWRLIAREMTDQLYNLV